MQHVGGTCARINGWVEMAFLYLDVQLWIHSRDFIKIMIKGDIQCNILTALQIKLTYNSVPFILV